MLDIRKPTAIILDIEGTTTSPKFVSDVLFPFIRSHLKKYLKENWGKDELAVTIDKLREQQNRDRRQGITLPLILDNNDEQGKDAVLKSVVSNVLWQMDEKRKSTALKQIQILVWVYGYERGFIKGQ